MTILLLVLALGFLYLLVRAIPHQTPGQHPSRTPTPRTPQPSKRTSGIRKPPKPPLPPPLARSTDRDQNVSEVRPHAFLPDYKITYTDGNGTETDRRITIIRIEGDVLEAYCHLRHGRRTFYFSRISQWTNYSTGEIVSDIMADFEAARKNSAHGVLDRMHGDLYPVMGVLLYLGKGNRRLAIDKRNAMIDTYKALCQDPRLSDSMINDSINAMNRPSATEYKRLVAELSTMAPETQALVLATARRFFASSKQLNAVEQEGLNELHNQLNL